MSHHHSITFQTPRDTFDHHSFLHLNDYTRTMHAVNRKSKHHSHRQEMQTRADDISGLAGVERYREGFDMDNSLIIHLINNTADFECDYYFMSLTVKTHRRNIAHQHLEEPFRFSIPLHILEANRGSFRPNYESPLTFRSSDASKLPLHLRSKKTQQKQEIPFSKPIATKPSSTLLSTLHSLQEKLSAAKKQFTPSQQKQEDSLSFDLNSFKQSSTGGGKWLDDSVLQKLQESTINLQSQKKLIGVVQSKERIVWAQSVKTYYIAEVAKGIAGVNERAMEHLSISLEILKSCTILTLPNCIIGRNLSLPRVRGSEGKKTLVLDLDETLFHCSEVKNSIDDMEINLSYDDTIEKAYVAIRPFAISFLKRVGKHFQVIAFTASQRSYADTILNEIDPDRQLIHHRLYRQHCVKLNSKLYAKDLRILGRDLSQVILVDNSPFSYLYQLENGVPILPYYHGEDTELLALERYLQQARKAQDVRELNTQTFKFHRYLQFQACEPLVKELYFSNP